MPPKKTGIYGLNGPITPVKAMKKATAAAKQKRKGGQTLAGSAPKVSTPLDLLL